MPDIGSDTLWTRNHISDRDKELRKAVSHFFLFNRVKQMGLIYSDFNHGHCNIKLKKTPTTIWKGTLTIASPTNFKRLPPKADWSSNTLFGPFCFYTRRLFIIVINC